MYSVKNIKKMNSVTLLKAEKTAGNDFREYIMGIFNGSIIYNENTHHQLFFNLVNLNEEKRKRGLHS